MSNTDIIYKEFIKYVHLHFETRITKEEIEEILHLEEDYNKDSPTSVGKGLVLNRLIFSGKKVTGEEFSHDQKLYTGINLWIADNMKGKSTIFKIVKYALTGVESIKPDIKKWIDEIILEFQIGKAIYTIFIEKTGRDKGALYCFGLDRFLELRENEKLNTAETEKEFEFRSKTQFEANIQEFFFDHFSLYPLKYTQKSSQKDEFEFNTATLSWATYFKSIYLESSNYEYLFFEHERLGSQGKKIFEMILGLPLTYPINMLGVLRDKVVEDIAKLKLTDKTRTETTQVKRIELEKKYLEVANNLASLQKDDKARFNEQPLINEYNSIQIKLNENRKKARIAGEAHQAEKERLKLLEEEIRNLEGDQRKINDEINRLTKQGLNVELYKETESFFSNLDIKVCPHCEVEVSENKKEEERKNHSCSLCGEKSKHQKIDMAELQAKLTRIKEEKEGHTIKLSEVERNLKSQKERAEKLTKSIADLYSKVIAVPSLDTDILRLKEIENQIEVIGKEREKQKELFEKRDLLIRDEAVLKFQLQEIEKEKTAYSAEAIERLTLKKDILEYALLALEKKRILLNKDILGKLEELILNEIHAFGLSSIKKIEINDKYELIFTQNEVTESFSDLAEGEKLRVKLAFYLSLIQLHIEHNLGRHPLFLIFDSPGSEEMIQEHLHGLSEILKNVNTRFQNKLQIFIGSALREFSHITDSEKATIKEKHEFIF